MRQIITMDELRALCSILNILMGNHISPKEKGQADFGFDKGCIFPSTCGPNRLESHVLYQERKDGNLDAIVRGSKRELHAALIGMVRVANSEGNTSYVAAGDLDQGAPNHTDHSKRGFTPK